MEALRDLLAETGELYLRGRTPVALVRGANNQLYSRLLTFNNVVMAAHRHCQPVKLDGEGNRTPITLPDRVAKMYLNLGERGVPPLAAITRCPLIRADGSIICSKGYDSETQGLYRRSA